MYLYNTTFIVDNQSQKRWSNWMQTTYLPTFLDVLPNITNDIYELEQNAQTPDSKTYSCQWHCNSLHELDEIMKYSNVLHEKLSILMGDKCLYFSTMMKKVVLL